MLYENLGSSSSDDIYLYQVSEHCSSDTGRFARFRY